MSKKHRGEPISEAEVHLQRARKQLEDAQTDSWEPPEPESCVKNAFNAYEHALVAAAIAASEDWEENHYEKQNLAKKLFDEGLLTRDISADLAELNRLRKDISYGVPGPELEECDLEDLVNGLEQFVDEVSALIDKNKEK